GRRVKVAAFQLYFATYPAAANAPGGLVMGYYDGNTVTGLWN
ncbi:MAG: hypothetical protein QOE58_55, partial [Actinomycetota bacterium]|nr:hypothetical protein [Actinomycetota bacterium]